MRRDLLIFAIEQAHQRFEGLIEDAVQTLRQAQGEAIIHVFRKELARFNLKRHRVVIRAAMGSADLLLIEQYPLRLAWKTPRRRTLDEVHGQSELISVLNVIEANLDYDWAYLFDRTELTCTN